MGILGSIFGTESERFSKGIQPLVAQVGSFEERYTGYTDDALRAETERFKQELKNGKTLDDILPEAFAVVREAARRTLNQRHYDVQILGGIVLHQGKIAEMRTGEGKTLVATLPVYLNALTGSGVHVVTVNDYLARRDAVWMGQIYAFLGLSIGVINTGRAAYLYDTGHTEADKVRDEEGSFKVVYEFLRPVEKKEAYAADITYGTNNEFGFDYLRDNIAYQASDIVQQKHAYAIVDEIDSILIDEARTPLIISMPAEESEDLYRTFADIARGLKNEDDFTIDEKRRAISLTEAGIEKAEKILGIDNIYTDAGIKFVHHLENAVKAKALYREGKEYVVREGEVIIVDEFTGRMQPGRRWSEGLHQAIEAKEGVRVQKESRTLASITFQNFFRLYDKLAGMTGTAETSAEEFYKVYQLETIVIPTNQPIARIDNDDLIYQNERGKLAAIVRKVKELQEREQPVLIGTVSVQKNEELSQALTQGGIAHELLNAKNHEREGEIIAQAGRPGAVTVATNMAGRGVDIKLGGNPGEAGAYEKVKAMGGLFVLGTERHDARRIDNQLRGRSGRQGDPGETQFFVSLEDSLMRIFASDTVKGLMERLKIPEDEPIQNKMITRSLESAQKKIEGLNFDARKHVLEFDTVLNTHRQTIYAQRRALLVGGNEDVAEVLVEIIGEDAETRALVDARKQALGDGVFYALARRMILQTIDMFWTEHLELMDHTRSSVNLRAYGQRDPLVEYKREGLRLFRELQMGMREQIASLLPKLGEDMIRAAEADLKRRHDAAQAVGGSVNAGEGRRTQTPIQKKEEPGRNDPCPCGSGKKYKKCHGA